MAMFLNSEFLSHKHMSVSRQELPHELLNDRMGFIDTAHEQEAELSQKIVQKHPEIRALVPRSYLA